MPTPNVTTDRAALRRLGSVLLLVGAAYLFAVLDTDGSLRTVLLRYGFAVAGVFAVAPPHVLLPDRAASLLQLLNPSPRGLFVRQGLPWALVVAAFLVPPVVIALGRGEMMAMPLVEIGLLVLGVGVYAFAHYTGIGAVSQAWQEGRAGGWYHRRVEADPRASMQIPPGLVPTVLASARVFAVGAGVTLGTGALANGGLAEIGWLPPALLLAVAGFRLARRIPRYDRDFYQTNALYTELLAAGGTRSTQREPIHPDAVYWAPPRLRPHVWASLVQLDRRLPLGRLFALGIIGLAVLLVQEASDAAVGAYLFLGLAAKNAAVFRLTAEPLAPRAFDLAQQRPGGWTATRFLVNLRWTLPLGLSLALAALLTDRFSSSDVALWSGVDVALALLTAALATYAAEVRYRRRFA